jgi:hypothetical protein
MTVRVIVKKIMIRKKKKEGGREKEGLAFEKIICLD